MITFRFTKIVQTGHGTYGVRWHFTIRGVSNPEKLRYQFPARDRVKRSDRGMTTG
jgi:polyisoprenoid-binding protein YceI